jgi:hypothetical protein
VKKPFRYISLGAGVQSSAVLVMSALGWYDCPKADVAIFADTQFEPAFVYEHLGKLVTFAAAHGIPVLTSTYGALDKDYLAGHRGGGARKGVSAIPAYAAQPDGRARMLQRHCTTDYKVGPIEAKVRECLGLVKGKRIPKGVLAEAMIGISRDEIQRIKDSRTRWVKNTYPLIDAGLFRFNCIDIIQRAGLPVPNKSACVACPFHDNDYWRELKDQHPAEFERAAKFDDQIRDMRHTGVEGGVFLHRSLKPLRMVDFSAPKEDQLNFGFDNECEGHCGV